MTDHTASRFRAWTCIAPVAIAFTLIGCQNARATLPTGRVVVSASDFLAATANGLATTKSTESLETVTGEPFSQAQVISIGTTSPNNNDTQFNLLTTDTVTKGDTMLASMWIRGSSADTKSPAQTQFTFQQSSSPWTGSISQGVASSPDKTVWTHIYIPFVEGQSFQSGQAMVTLYLSYGPQTVEIGDLNVQDLGTSITFSQLVDEIADATPLGNVHLAVDRTKPAQIIEGFGGDFCQARYGSSDTIDAVGTYCLNHLNVRQARIGIPLNFWAPTQGAYVDEGPPHAALLLMQVMHQRHIPIIASVWEGPQWMLPGGVEVSGRVLDPSEYQACIDAIGQFLVTARDKYGVDVDYFTFNEANYGVNFLFTPQTIDNFVRQAGPSWRKLGLRTKFLIGDTTGGAAFPAYVQTLLNDPQAAPYLGPLAFHMWDVLGATDAQYEAIAAVGKNTGRSIYCTEGGWDAALWQQPNPWGTWDNALHTAQAYARTLRLSGASTIDYWTYENNYPLISADGVTPYPVFSVMKQVQDAIAVGSTVVGTSVDNSAIEEVASFGPRFHQCSVLLVDTSGSADITVTGLPGGQSFKAIGSSENGQLLASAPIRSSMAGKLTVHMEARTVVTLVSVPDAH